MAKTLGGKEKEFEWQVSKDGILVIHRIEADMRDLFGMNELFNLLTNLQNTFKDKYFPLANNVATMKSGDEADGLGKFIYDIENAKNEADSKSLAKAQSASQLAVILMESGILSWNGKKRGIQLRIINMPKDTTNLLETLNKHKHKQIKL